MAQRKKQAAAKQTFVFPAPLASEYPAKQDVECVARIRELAVYACMRAVLELYDPLPI